MNESVTSEKIYKILRYIISGGTGVCVNIAVLYTCVHYLHFWYLASSATAFVIALVCSFVLQKYWTFKDRDRDNLQKQALWYVLIAIVNIALNTLIVYACVHGLRIDYLLAQIIGSALVAVESYFVYRIIFQSRLSATEFSK